MYIALEGVDFTYKSTVIEKLSEHLIDYGWPVLTTRRPYSESLRKILTTEKLPTEAEIFLFLADTSYHYEEVLLKTPEKYFILSDRCHLSSLAYQRARLEFEGMDPQDAEDKLNLFYGNCNLKIPDIIFLLTLPPTVLTQRVKAAEESAGLDVIESRSIKYRFRVQEIYQEWASRKVSDLNIKTIYGNYSSDQITKKILEILRM